MSIRRFKGALLLAASLLLTGPALAAEGLPAYKVEKSLSGSLNSVGDPVLAPLMDAWIATLQGRQPGLVKGERWEHRSVAMAVGALMFERADLAPMTREPSPTELSPYAHQFHGDMMKTPMMVRMANLGDGKPAWLAVNRRPGAPLPPTVKAFLSFALSREGQEIVERQGFVPLALADAAVEREKIEFFLATLDPGLPSYKPSAPVSGEISSTGSDGMKALMDRWEQRFRKIHPGVAKGERWEHAGTLNGFHALLAGETDLAPMGRELWPQERAAAAEVLGPDQRIVEIAVARGGFNTPQRTTAQAIFVHQDNPLSRINMAQLAQILRADPAITRWGQLGLKGAWADRPITLYMPKRVAPNAMSMQMMVLGGGDWNVGAKEGTIAETATAAAADPASIAFGGFEEGGPGLKPLAVAAGNSTAFIQGTGETVANGRYPLTRYMYIRLVRRADEPLASQVREFLRYILSREGQEPILHSGYFPLTQAEAAVELNKLD